MVFQVFSATPASRVAVTAPDPPHLFCGVGNVLEWQFQPVVTRTTGGEQFVDGVNVAQQVPHDAARSAAVRVRLVVEFSVRQRA